MSTVNSKSGNAINCHVLVVGAGLSGIYALYRFRQLGLKVRVLEAGSDLGGVWHWNRYPGARVDSEFPFYQLSIPEVYATWKWSERYPDHEELRRFFAHMDKVLDLRKDIHFNARVNSCEWDKTSNTWTVKSDAGHVARCKYLFLATGLLHSIHSPAFPGLNTYQGTIHHSNAWPDDLKVRGKKVAIIGAGSTAIQLTQELAKEAQSLTLLMRSPSYCLPMRQRPIIEAEHGHLKAYYGSLFDAGKRSITGFPVGKPDKGFWEVSVDERKQYWEELWLRGGSNFSLSNFREVSMDPVANRMAYDFWRSKVHARMQNKSKAELVAPLKMPYYFGTKRVSLEHDYYEMVDQEHVDIVDLGENPLKTFNATGMLFEDGTQRDFDIVVLATGYDGFGGSLSRLGLKNKEGVDIRDLWDKEIATYLGMLIHGFPNAFMVFGPQAPVAFTNAPTIIECQVDFIVDLVARIELDCIRSVEASAEAQMRWTALVEHMCNCMLLPFTNSWWNAGNVPGKRKQMLIFPAGIDAYITTCRKKLETWDGFEVMREC